MAGAWRWGVWLTLIAVGAALAAFAGIGVETVIETSVWDQERLLTVSTVATMGALFVAGTAIVFQAAFYFGRAWNDLENQRDRLEGQQKRLGEHKELIEELQEALKEDENVREALKNDPEFLTEIKQIWADRDEEIQLDEEVRDALMSDPEFAAEIEGIWQRRSAEDQNGGDPDG